MENFRGKRDFLKGGPKFPNGISERKFCAFHSLFLTSSRPFGLDRLATVNGTANPVWKFPFRF